MGTATTTARFHGRPASSCGARATQFVHGPPGRGRRLRQDAVIWRLDCGMSPAYWAAVGSLNKESRHLISPGRRQGVVALVTSLALYSSGCLSHEYRLPPSELTR